MIALPPKHVVIALRVVGCDADAVVLQSVLAVANGAGMTHAAIQRDRAGLQPYAISTFSKVHGGKWDAAARDVYNLADAIDWARVLQALERYIETHRDIFEAALTE